MVIYQLIEQQHLWFVLLVMTAMLAIREFCQICVYGRRYFYSWENWFEICIIVITALLLSESIELGAKRHLAATVIVLSWIELIKLFGYSGQLPGHDSMAMYVTMLFKVTKSFFNFLCLYIFFILAFGLGFYVSLNTYVITSNKMPKPVTDSEEINRDTNVAKVVNTNAAGQDYKFFNTSWQALVKTSTMFSGEFEFGDLPFDNDSAYAPIAYLFFLSFVFCIAIVMMNLLTGLAVSDIGVIQKQAEIVGYKSKIEIIWKSEKLRLRLKNMILCKLFGRCFSNDSIRRFLKDNKFPIYPNDPNDPIHPIHPPDFFPHCLGCFQEKEFIKPAKQIILERSKKLLSTDEKIENMENKLEEKIQHLDAKMTEILEILKTNHFKSDKS